MRGLAWLLVYKGLADFSRFTNDSRQAAVPVVTGARTGLSKKDWQHMEWSCVYLCATLTLPRPCCPSMENKAKKRRLRSNTAANKTPPLATPFKEAGEGWQNDSVGKGTDCQPYT